MLVVDMVCSVLLLNDFVKRLWQIRSTSNCAIRSGNNCNLRHFNKHDWCVSQVRYYLLLFVLCCLLYCLLMYSFNLCKSLNASSIQDNVDKRRLQLCLSWWMMLTVFVTTVSSCESGLSIYRFKHVSIYQSRIQAKHMYMFLLVLGTMKH